MSCFHNCLLNETNRIYCSALHQTVHKGVSDNVANKTPTVSFYLRILRRSHSPHIFYVSSNFQESHLKVYKLYFYYYYICLHFQIFKIQRKENVIFL